MSNLGDLITNEDETIPPAVFNAKTIWPTTGDTIPTHNIDEDVGAIVCTADGSGYLVDHMYIRNADKTSWVDVFKNHLHTSDADGGSFFEIKKGNAKSILEYNFQNLMKSQFISTVTTVGGTATISDQVDSTTKYVELFSPISTAYCDMIAGGLRLDFGKPFLMQAKYKVFENTNILFRIGAGLSLIANSGNQAQVGWEGCGSEPKLTVVSANGTDRSPNLLSNMLQTNPTGLRIEFFPNEKIIGTDSVGGLTNKTDNLPLASSSTAGNSTFRIGHKTTNTSTGTSRAMRMYAAYLIGYIYDSNPSVAAWL